MLDLWTLVSTGFSIVAALMLLLVYLFYIKSLNKTPLAVTACIFLTISLFVLQAAHLQFILAEQQPLSFAYYRLAIFAVPASFFYFSRSILFPELKYKALHLVHLFPLGFIFFENYQTLVVLSFVLGFVYCFWLGSILFRLRRLRKRFKEEFFFFALFSLMAAVVLTFGVLSSIAHTNAFYYVYANSIALAYFLVAFMLMAKPSVVEELNEALALGYVQSTLGNTNVEQKQAALERLMTAEKIYQNSDLSLASLADALDLSSHQLSELINTRFGLHFSRYVRQQRIAEAKQLLLAEKDVSILSLSMQVGFTSQSNFYAAFKEEVGLSPGQYRAQALNQTPSIPE